MTTAPAGVPVTARCPGRARLIAVVGPAGPERTAMLRALARAGDPPAVLVDCADAGLDEPDRLRVWSALRAVADSGTAVVAAGETAEGVGSLPDRTVLLARREGLG